MSDDLIERLRAELQTFLTVFGEDSDRPMVVPRLLVSEVQQIIVALKTVQGIESLRKTIYGLEYDDGEWTVSTLVKVHRRQTLALAVEAATQ